MGTIKDFKYKPSDYPSISYYLEDIEKKYNNYISSNKDEIKLIILKEAINELKNGLKSAILLNQISTKEADEMLDYYWELI